MPLKIPKDDKPTRPHRPPEDGLAPVSGDALALSADLRQAFEESWKRNEAGFRYLAVGPQNTYTPPATLEEAHKEIERLYVRWRDTREELMIARISADVANDTIAALRALIAGLECMQLEDCAGCWDCAHHAAKNVGWTYCQVCVAKKEAGL